MENVGFAFFDAVVFLVHQVIWLYIWVVIIASVITWVQPDPYNPIVQILDRLTYPVLEKVRNTIPTTFGGVDLAPIVVILGLTFIDRFLGTLLS
ncbi:MAG: YggT family protein [Campylobacterales bacterium]|nr:YggT family protein [Campylobacterales bacterium]